MRKSENGHTLLEMIVSASIFLIVLGVMGWVFVSAMRHYKAKEKEIKLIREKKLAYRRMEMEFGKSSIDTVTIVQNEYTVSGDSYECDAIAFFSTDDRNGEILADEEGNLKYQSEVIFYFNRVTRTLYCQKNYADYSSTPRPDGTFTPRPTGPDMDRPVARDVLEVRFTDYTGDNSVTIPCGDYIRARLIFEKEGIKDYMDRNFDMRKSRTIEDL